MSDLMKGFFTYSYEEENYFGIIETIIEKDLCQNGDIKANVVNPQCRNGVTAWII